MMNNEMNNEKKQIWQTGAMGSCCDWCRLADKCDAKLHPISKAPCIKCSEFKEGGVQAKT